MAMIQSTEKPERKFIHVRDLNNDTVGKVYWIRARLHTSRAKGFENNYILLLFIYLLYI